jgi:hypothetical protein
MDMISDLGWKEGDILRIGVDKEIISVRRDKVSSSYRKA